MEIKTAQEKIAEAERDIFEIIDRIHCTIDVSVHDIRYASITVVNSQGSSQEKIVSIHLDVRL